MKWRDYLCFALFAFLSFFVGSVIINQKNNVSAVTNYSVTIDKSNVTLPYYLCGNTTGINCSDFNYISVSFPSNATAGSYIRLYFEKVGSWFRTYDFYTNFPFTIVDISYLDSNSQVSILPISNFSGDVVYTFMESYASNPSGSLSITQNGTYDVTNYAEAVVDVPPEIIQGDYHDDLVSLKKAIVIVPAVALVIYFLYAIYKMLLGGKTL